MNLKKVFRKYKNEFKVPNTATSTGGISFYQHIVFYFFHRQILKSVFKKEQELKMSLTNIAKCDIHHVLKFCNIF